MRNLAVLGLLCCLAAPVWGQPKIEGKTHYPPYALVRLGVVDVPPKTGTLWEVYPPERVDIATTRPDRLEFAAPPGVYQAQILLVTVDESGTPQLRKLTARVTIGDGPDPGPNPPLPPPPTPTDPLFEALQAAYTADTGAAKAKDRLALASVYKDGAKHLIDNPGNVRTAGQLYEYLKKLSAERLPADALKSVRNVVGKELNTILPTDPDVSIAVDRPRIAACFTKVAGYLEALK